MSEKPKRSGIFFIAAAFCLLLAIAAVGLYSSLPQHSENKPSSTLDLTSSGYQISKPSNGPLILTLPIQIKISGQTASATVQKPSHERRHQIKLNQEVMLQDTQGKIMPLPGKIISLTPQEDTSLLLSIDLPKKIKSDLFSNHASVITYKSASSQRLPISALQKDINGNMYVWSAEDNQQNPQTYNAKIEWLDNPIISEDYIETNIRNASIKKFILNPDKHIENGKSYEMTSTKYKAPIFDPIRLSMHNLQLSFQEMRRQELEERHKKCMEGGTKDPSSAVITTENSSMPATGNCKRTPTLETAKSTEDILEMLLNRQPK